MSINISQSHNLRRFVLSALVAVLFSCGSDANEPVPSRDTSISGKIMDGRADSVSIFKYDTASLGQRQLIDTKKIASNGDFELTWKVVGPSRYEIAIGNETVWWGILLQAGEKVEVQIDGGDSGRELSFQGESKDFQQYLWDSQKAFGPGSSLTNERNVVINGSDPSLFENWAIKSRAQREEYLRSFLGGNELSEKQKEYAAGQINYSIEADRVRYYLERLRAERSGELVGERLGYSPSELDLENKEDFLVMAEYVNFVTGYAEMTQDEYSASLSGDVQVDEEEWLGIEIENLLLSIQGMGKSAAEVATADFVRRRITRANDSESFGLCLDLIDFYVQTSETDIYHPYLHNSLVARRRTQNF